MVLGLVGHAHAAPPWAGRPVADVLRELRAGGLELVWNDELVPPELPVRAEPAARDGAALAREILAPHGLALRQVGPATFAVVRAPPSRDEAPAGPLPELVVTASRFRLAAQELSPHVFLTREELKALPRFGEDSLKAVHRLPGAASNGISGLAHIRGGEENETQVVLDGMALEEPFHLKNFFSPVSLLDSRILGTVDVYAGGYPVQYGDRMSAVVNAATVDLPPGPNYELGLSLFHASALAAGDLGSERTRWLASARRSNLDEVADLAGSEVGEPRYFDAFGRLTHEFSDRTRAGLRLLASSDRARLNDKARTQEAEAVHRNAYLWATLEHDWTDGLTGRAVLSFTDVDNRRDGTVAQPGRRTGTVSDDRKYAVGGMRLELDYEGGTLAHRVGVEAATLSADYRYQSQVSFAPGYPFPGDPGGSVSRDLALAPDGNRFSAWLSSRWQVTDRLTAEAGLRWGEQTYDRVDGGTQLSPRLNLLLDLDADTRLRAAWGRFYQPQGIHELQVEDGVDRYWPAQRADHLILGLEHSFSPGLEVRLEGYYKDYEELRPRYENLFDPFVLIPELEADRVAVAPGAGAVRGVEAWLGWRQDGPFSGWLSYAWSRAEENLGAREVERSWDQRHTVNGGLTWRQDRWEVTLAATWHTGWPTTPLTLVVEEVDGEPVPRVVQGGRNSDRLDDFASVDFRAGYTRPLSRGELQAFVEFTNLLGFRNTCCLEYEVAGDGPEDFRLVRDEDYWPRFVPNLGVLWRF